MTHWRVDLKGEVHGRPSPPPSHSIPISSGRPPARNGRAPPKPGIAGGRCSRAGSGPPPRPCSTWPASGRAPGARRGRRRGRADARRGAARRRRRLRAGDRHLARDPALRAQGRDARPALPTSRRASSTASGTTPCAEGSFDAAISRVGLIYFPDQQRALAGIRRALQARRALRRGRLFDAGQESVLLHPGRHHPPARASCRRRCPGSRGRSRSAATACSPRRWSRRASATSKCGASTRPCGCRRPRSACASSASRSARCTR